MSDEFEINGIQYRARKLSAMDQLFVARQLTPLIGSFVPLLQMAAREAAVGGNVAGAILSLDVAQVMPLAQAIADLPEKNTNDLIARCLSSVQRGTTSPAGTTWASVWSTSANRPMFEDLDLMTMLTLVAHVVRKDLGNFIPALFSGSTGGAGLFQTPTL
ncbi:hypothetical protein V5F79_22130 [Xanthobacter flavus]|uniref:phage tail assembly chaperone n=1 Tax=Xanthobacter flavus TaxID=281 RepID=UPI0037299B2A